MPKRLIVIFLILSSAFHLAAQEAWVHTSNKGIYEYLDELATIGIIETNPVIKPWSRVYIAGKLHEADTKRELLNKRQSAELEFYLRDYNKELQPGKDFSKRFDLFYYKDSLFTFSLNPVLGIEYYKNANGPNFHRWNGAEVFAYMGPRFAAYASLRDNHDEEILSGVEYLDIRPGARYKSGQDYSEMRGGLSASWGWGSLALVKDHTEWGTNIHYPNIISSKAPSPVHLKLHLTPAGWFEFNYMHVWLNSGVIDSLRSYTFANSYGTGYRTLYRKKFMAANMFTVKPFKGLNFSFGNSIIYSDADLDPVYLIPFLFYKSIDHTKNQGLNNDGGQNSQLFFDLSSRQIRHLHLFATVFFDDLSTRRLKDNGHFDYYSLKFGFDVSDLIPNLSARLEYIQTYTLVYKHDMPTTTYESNFYTLGHYLQDNSRGFYADITFRPVKGFYARAYYDHAAHGPDHEELGTDRVEITELFLDQVVWESSVFGLELKWQPVNDAFVFMDLSKRKVTGEVQKYTPEYYHGDPFTISFGVNFGF